MLVLGGFILWVEKRQSRAEPKIADVDALRPIDALMIGVAQVFALVKVRPVRAVRLWAGCFGNRAENGNGVFIFFTVPMMVAATAYDVLNITDFSPCMMSV